jgi:hypothetical protein
MVNYRNLSPTFIISLYEKIINKEEFLNENYEFNII